MVNRIWTFLRPNHLTEPKRLGYYLSMDTKELFVMPNGQPYPPHMQLLLAKCKAHDMQQAKFKFTSTIKDVTPKGYGPNE